MLREMFTGKIHRATVTDCKIDYPGSLTVDVELLERAGILVYEKIQLVNVNNGSRLETYTIPGQAGSGDIIVNGAAARLAQPGDLVIIIAYGMFQPEELADHRPRGSCAVMATASSRSCKETPSGTEGCCRSVRPWAAADDDHHSRALRSIAMPPRHRRNRDRARQQAEEAPVEDAPIEEAADIDLDAGADDPYDAGDTGAIDDPAADIDLDVDDEPADVDLDVDADDDGALEAEVALLQHVPPAVAELAVVAVVVTMMPRPQLVAGAPGGGRSRRGAANDDDDGDEVPAGRSGRRSGRGGRDAKSKKRWPARQPSEARIDALKRSKARRRTRSMIIVVVVCAVLAIGGGTAAYILLKPELIAYERVYQSGNTIDDVVWGRAEKTRKQHAKDSLAQAERLLT